MYRVQLINKVVSFCGKLFVNISTSNYVNELGKIISVLTDIIHIVRKIHYLIF